MQGEYGRPELDAASQALAEPGFQHRLRFNLSHTEELFAVVVTNDRDCGVDVETTTRTTDLVGVGKRSFAEQEFADFMAVTGDAQRRRFFEYWTLKESYIKAIGTGLSTPLRNFSFDVTSQAPTVSFVPEHDDQPERWSFGLQRPTPNEQLAWCIEQGERPEIEWFR